MSFDTASDGDLVTLGLSASEPELLWSAEVRYRVQWTPHLRRKHKHKHKYKKLMRK